MLFYQQKFVCGFYTDKNSIGKSQRKFKKTFVKSRAKKSALWSANGVQRKRLGEELVFETRQPEPKLNL